ncbi:hypothetical protein QTQ03_29405 [Micromonospora sp. WMMA1363]|uniref:hypothetical protein n=1 Tax=Micromonospora sp. WMMA1363 TaxID=3053985 RepID=UPI00259CC600|nr:hypothetical protein [Micromonospora sp. WMMA1363]MDM4723497.1 hypothetical protein [Micromonospora sp. WMMA1363]
MQTGPVADLPAGLYEPGDRGQTLNAGRHGWYVRALSTAGETLAQSADGPLAAVLIADALRRHRPGWRVTIRRYAGPSPQLAA